MSHDNGISVIVTTFNKEEYILQTLKSAIVQFNKEANYQIIVVDDGSSDRSYEMAKDYLQSSKVDYKIFKQKNTGPSVAINNSLKFVKYSFIKLLDGDDLLSPDSLDYMKKQMEKNSIDLLYGGWEWQDNPNKYKFKRNKPEASIMINPINKFIVNGWGGSSNLMIKTDVMLSIGGCDKTVFVQDFSIPLRVAGNHLIQNISQEFAVGSTEKVICVGPSYIENRIMDNNGQTLYDLSIATLNFIDKTKHLNKYIKRKALKKIIARCWSWRRRVLKEKFFCKFFFSYCSSKFNLGLESSNIRYHVFKTWISSEKIRKLHTVDKSKKKILVYVGLDLLGDGLLKLPFLKCLRNIFPNSEITWLAGKGESVFNRSLKQLSEGLIDSIYEESFGSSLLDIFKKNKFGNYDIVIDTQKRFLTTIVLKRIKTKTFVSSCSKYLFSDLVPRIANEENIGQHLVNISEIFSCKKIKFLNITNNAKSNKIAICPGASVIWKRWAFDNFIDIAEHLIKRKLLPVFILGPKEKDLYRNLTREFGNKVKIYNSDDPIQTIKIAEKCRAGVSNDTGCGHLISSTGIPVLTLFGPTNHEKFSPIGNPISKSISSQKLFKSKNINAIPTNLVIRKLKMIFDN